MENEKVEKVSVSFGATINVGNFENRNIHYSFSTYVMPNETVEQAKNRAEEIVARWVNEKIKSFLIRLSHE